MLPEIKNQKQKNPLPPSQQKKQQKKVVNKPAVSRLRGESQERNEDEVKQLDEEKKSVMSIGSKP